MEFVRYIHIYIYMCVCMNVHICIYTFTYICMLPEPIAANNPLKYKISWNPLGIYINACVMNGYIHI
jgi:hypothetical protein